MPKQILDPIYQFLDELKALLKRSEESGEPLPDDFDERMRFIEDQVKKMIDEVKGPDQRQ